jgi:hypothetical protein
LKKGELNMTILRTKLDAFNTRQQKQLLRLINTDIPADTQTLTNKTITGTFTGNITGNVTGEVTALGAAESAEHGAGVIGTGIAPATYRYNLPNGDICTEIQIDITGLGVVGTAANDVIGLAAGGNAYIGRYVTATCGIVYRAEVICLETPGEGTATITTDIDVAFNASGTLAYDGAAGAAELNVGGMAAGFAAAFEGLALTANDYIYLVEGDTAATTGVYNAGMIIVRLFGHAVLA